MYTLETVEYKNHIISISQDDYPENPREWDNLGMMYCFHTRYDLGDVHVFSVEEVKQIYNDGNNISLPLYLYDHSGITMNTTGFSCRFDSGQVGIITVSKEDIRKEYNWKRLTKKRLQKIKDYLKSEVKTYDNYIMGNFYTYDICHKDDKDDMLDSCGGFCGYDHEKSGLLDCAKEFINSYTN